MSDIEDVLNRVNEGVVGVDDSRRLVVACRDLEGRLLAATSALLAAASAITKHTVGCMCEECEATRLDPAQAIEVRIRDLEEKGEFVARDRDAWREQAKQTESHLVDALPFVYSTASLASPLGKKARAFLARLEEEA